MTAIDPDDTYDRYGVDHQIYDQFYIEVLRKTQEILGRKLTHIEESWFAFAYAAKINLAIDSLISELRGEQ